MNNFNPTNNERRFKAHVSVFGTTQLHLRNPYMIAWWSAAFPGFGHLLLSKYLRGYALFLWEILINNMAKINLAIIYSFTGNFEMAKEVLEPRWMLLYIPVYIFAIWDSYRTTVDLNKVYILAERENADISTFSIGATETNNRGHVVNTDARHGATLYPSNLSGSFYVDIYHCFCILFECSQCCSFAFSRGIQPS